VRVVTAAVAALLFCCYGCSKSRTYELHGQVLAVNTTTAELTVKHEDIRGFMPGMTMPFPVRDERLLQGREPGELITATLVVEEDGAYLSAIRRTGMAPLEEPPRPPAAVDVVTAGEHVADTTFRDQSGRARRLSDWRGQSIAVTFTYTRCPLPNFCPLMDRHFQDVQHEIAQDATLRGRVHLLSVSFDPAYDTPTVLAAHAARVSADSAHWTFLTALPGEREQLDRFASGFGVSIIRDPPSRERSGEASRADAEIVHNLRTAVIDSQGRLVTILSGNEWTPSELLAHLRKAG
jgi:protein SCO1/2